MHKVTRHYIWMKKMKLAAVIDLPPKKWTQRRVGGSITAGS